MLTDFVSKRHVRFDLASFRRSFLREKRTMTFEEASVERFLLIYFFFVFEEQVTEKMSLASFVNCSCGPLEV